MQHVIDKVRREFGPGMEQIGRFSDDSNDDEAIYLFTDGNQNLLAYVIGDTVQAFTFHKKLI